MKLFFDIETIPCQNVELSQRLGAKVKLELPKITKTGQYKSQADIDIWIAEERPKKIKEDWLKTSFNAAYGEIVSIAWAIEDQDVKVLCRALGESEKALLQGFFTALAKDVGNRRPTWIGHYITGFDLRFLWHRCVVHNVRPTITIPYTAKPWDDSVYDTCVEWVGLKSRISQDDLCAVLGIEGKPDDIDGSKVWPFVEHGNVKRVAEYNKDDVEKNRKIYKRMHFNGQGKTTIRG